MANNTKNLANAIVATNVGTSATTLVLEAGYGDSMPAVPFFLTCTPPGQLSTMGNSEVVLVTARSTDTLTIERAKKLTTAKNIQAGWVVSNSVYVETSAQIGDIMMTLNAIPRTGRLFMDGGTYQKADWPLMWQYIVDNPAYGTTTSTKFTLLDMRERMPFGKSSNVPYATLGNMGGSSTKTLTEAQLPNISGRWIVHGQESGTIFYNREGYATGTATGQFKVPTSSNVNAQSLQSPGFNFGKNQPHDVMNPYIVVNYEVIAE